MNNVKPKILVIVATTRQGRVGRNVADWYLAEARKVTDELSFELYDIADLQLPIFDEAAPPMMHDYTEVQKQMEATFGSADGFVFVTGEYNHSIPGSLKNLLDYNYSGWQRKVAAYVGYGGFGGVRAIEHLIQIMCFFDIASLVEQVNINQVWQAFDESGNLKSEFIVGSIDRQLAELTWWAKTLKTGREATAHLTS